MATSSSSGSAATALKQPLAYPSARRDEVYDTFKSAAKGQVKVHDPYRWLHEPPSKSSDTKAFVEAQEKLTRDFLEQDPNRAALREKLTENWNYARFSCPSLKADGYYYYTYNSGLQAQAPFYRIKASELPSSFPENQERPGGELFYDPNRISRDGTASIALSAFSETGKYWAYGVSRSGSDWSTVYVRKTDNPHAAGADPLAEGKEPVDEGRLDDVIRFVKYSGITWLHDDSGFFYQRYPTSELDHGLDTDDISGTGTDADINAMLYFHKLGTPQSADILVRQDTSNPSHMASPEITEDGKYMLLHISKDTAPSAKLWVAKLDGVDWSSEKSVADTLLWDKLVDQFGAQYSYVANDGPLFTFMSNDKAPKYKLVTRDLSKPDCAFSDLIAEDPDSILTSASVVNGSTLLVIRSRDVKDELTMHDLGTGAKRSQVASGLIGSFAQLTGRRHHNEFFFKLVGFSNPGLVYRYEFARPEKGEQLWRSTVVQGLKPDEFTTEQVFYTSKDGTRVPMFIVTPAGVPKDGTAAALQYGYGGFSHAMDPFFSPAMLTFVKHYGMRLAVANIRGGAEYGEEWHEAGTKERKQNVFDDFQYATRYLVDEKYAAPKKVAIFGGSNGGLLVAACANQAPELFGAVLCAVGVLDMLRFHLFTIGRAWTADYGCADEPADFDYLSAYSPLHNVPAPPAPGTGTVDAPYPPTLLLTGDHDDRVVPLHSFKHIATLQHTLPNNPNPLLMRVDLKAGHGAGKSTQQAIEEAVDRWGFVALTMGLQWRN